MYIAEKNFKPRTTRPEKGNKYYIRKASGGWSPCIKGNPLDKDCDALANCVSYEIGRFNEETNQGGITFWASMNAENFYANAYKWGLETGQEPKIGACMCWSGGEPAKASDGLGHVANCEKVYSSTKVDKSDSGYKSYIFKYKTVNKGSDGNWGMSKKYKFLGFVYNPNIIYMTNPVERNQEVNQLQVIKNKLRMRIEPNLKGEILGFAELGYYNDLETCEADGYIWHKVAENNWLAEVDGYVKLLPKVEFQVGDKVTFKELPDYFIITGLEDNNANVTMATPTSNLNKID